MDENSRPKLIFVVVWCTFLCNSIEIHQNQFYVSRVVMFAINDYIASYFGVDVAAITLLLAIVAAYPASLLYIVVVNKHSTHFKSLYFLLIGLVILYLSYGLNSIHYLVNCCFCYCTLKWLPGKWAVIFNFIFTFTYLMTGYWLNQVEWNYSITWTMPQCVLTLRLIAISFDIFDGTTSKKVCQKFTCLELLTN